MRFQHMSDSKRSSCYFCHGPKSVILKTADSKRISKQDCRARNIGTLFHFRTDHKAYYEWTQEHVEAHSSWEIKSNVEWPFEKPHSSRMQMVIKIGYLRDIVLVDHADPSRWRWLFLPLKIRLSSVCKLSSFLRSASLQYKFQWHTKTVFIVNTM